MRWKFKMYEAGHFDALDLVLTPAIVYGWYSLGRWSHGAFWFWCVCALFWWASALAFVKQRKVGRCRWPWEERPKA